MGGTIDIRVADPSTPEARALLAQSHALMQSLFDAGDNHYLSIEALQAPDIQFFIAEVDGQAAGCAALAKRDGYGEVKSMFVDPAHRGAKLGAALLGRLETAAKAQGLDLLRLETGDSLTAAHRLYENAGFIRCGAFGAYAVAPTSLFMEKRL